MCTTMPGCLYFYVMTFQRFYHPKVYSLVALSYVCIVVQLSLLSTLTAFSSSRTAALSLSEADFLCLPLVPEPALSVCEPGTPASLSAHSQSGHPPR